MNSDESTTRNDLLLRRLRLVSDIMEDYQDNVRSAFNLLELDLALVDPPQVRQRQQTQYLQGRRADFRGGNAGAYRTAWNQPSDLHRYFPNYARNQRANSGQPDLTQYRFAADYLQYLNQYADNLEPAGFTNEQIEMATTEIQFVAEPESRGNQCPITLDYFQPGQELLRVNGCGHLFSKPALMEWFNRHRDCPVCRGRPLMRRREQQVPIVLSATVEFQHNDASFNYPSPAPENPAASSSASTEQINAVNTLISSLADGITHAFTRNEEYYEQEFTVALRDLMALAATNHRVVDSSGSLPFP